VLPPLELVDVAHVPKARSNEFTLVMAGLRAPDLHTQIVGTTLKFVCEDFADGKRPPSVLNAMTTHFSHPFLRAPA
jgi:hypothetical protein